MKWPTQYRSTAYFPDAPALERGLSKVRREQGRSAPVRDFQEAFSDRRLASVETDPIGFEELLAHVDLMSMLDAADQVEARRQFREIMLHVEVNDLLDSVERNQTRLGPDSFTSRIARNRGKLNAIRRELAWKDRTAAQLLAAPPATRKAVSAALGLTRAQLRGLALLRLPLRLAMRFLPLVAQLSLAWDVLQLVRPGRPAVSEGYEGHGWAKYGNCNSGDARHTVQFLNSSSPSGVIANRANTCLANQAVSGGQLISVDVPANKNVVYVFGAPNSFNRYKFLEYWWRPNVWAGPTPWTVGEPAVSPRYKRPPFPETPPVSIWNRVEKPNGDRKYQVERPSRRVRTKPDGNFEFPGGPKPPAFKPRQPPKKHEKENKGQTKPGDLRKIRRILNIVTESTDYLDAFYNALPDEVLYYNNKNTGEFYISKYTGEKIPVKRSVESKAKALARHWLEIDIGKAFANLLLNEVEDRFYGRVGKVIGKSSADLGLTYGAQTGDATEGGGSVRDAGYDRDYFEEKDTD
jgi:hypothetical protein